MPALRRFQPELIFISAGFDGCYMDPLGGRLGLRPEDFKWATQEVMEVGRELRCCNGRIVSVLEGGYDAGGSQSGLVQCVEAHVQALRGM